MTSITDLAAAMSITPPSLYGAFGDEKRLFMEAVDRYQEGHGCFAVKALVEEPTAELAIRHLLRGAVKSFSGSRTPRGCLVVPGATRPDSFLRKFGAGRRPR